MATFHAEGKLDLIMLVGDEKFVHVTEKCAMFDFLLGSIHVSKDVAFGDNDVVIDSIYILIPSSSPQGLYWMVNNGIYRSVGESLVNNSQDIVITMGTVTSIINYDFLIIKIE
jgi:hypothetical protein